MEVVEQLTLQEYMELKQKLGIPAVMEEAKRAISGPDGAPLVTIDPKYDTDTHSWLTLRI